MSWTRRGSGLLAAGALLLAGGLVAPTTASAATVTFTDGQGVEYTADDADVSAGAVVTGYSGASSTVDIPATVSDGTDYYDVVEVGVAAFDTAGLTSVSIGENVTIIEQKAFQHNSLETLVIPDSVLSIEGAAFFDNNLNDVVWGDNIWALGMSAFAQNELETLNIPDSMTWIGMSAFASNDLTTLDIPDQVTHLERSAFRRNNLTQLTLGTGLTEVREGVFADNLLTEVTVPDGVDAIKENAFGGNPGLESVVFTGSAPTVEPASGINDPSFDTASGALVLSFPWRFGDPQTAGGYEAPVWEGYDTQAIATVEFALNGASGTAPADQNVVVGETATEPADPTVPGFVFTGWFTDAALTDEFDFSTSIDGDLTLYADLQEEPEDYLSVSKTVDASYVRVFDWDLTKSGQVGDVTVDGDTASAEVDYTVTATPLGARNDYHLLRGEITVTNNILEPMTFTITDEPDIGVDATCSVSNSDGAAEGDISIAALEEMTFDYFCDFEGVPEDGTNTAEVIWWGGEGQTSATEDVIFEERDTSFDTVNVGDDKTTPDNGFVDLGEAQWNVDGIPAEFNYTLTQSDLPVGECTSFTNTAMIAQTEQTAQATLEICPEPAAAPTPAPPSDPEVPAVTQTGGLPQTGLDGAAPIGAALLLLVIGGAAMMIRRKVKN